MSKHCVKALIVGAISIVLVILFWLFTSTWLMISASFFTAYFLYCMFDWVFAEINVNKEAREALAGYNNDRIIALQNRVTELEKEFKKKS